MALSRLTCLLEAQVCSERDPAPADAGVRV